VTTVIIKKICPVCGGPRGDAYEGVIREDGESYRVDNWRNACGHKDWFQDVLFEAGVYPYEDPQKPRLLLINEVDGDGLTTALLAYRIPQGHWRRDLTRQECDLLATPELWGPPTKSTQVGSAG
jgi:hypothetical protein